MMETVLLTGASGFIGKNLIERFKKDSHFNILALLDKSDENGKKFLNSYNITSITIDDFPRITQNIDYCVHLASYGVAYGARDIHAMIDVNIRLASDILKFCAGHSCKCFINTGSCFEYGSLVKDRLIIEEDKLCPDDIYAASKVACETFLGTYSKILNQKMITIRPFGVYGKYENQKRIMPLIFTAGICKKPIDLTGGEQIRDYMDVRDVADCIYRLLLNQENVSNGSSINICSGKPISLKCFIESIIEVCSFDPSLYRFGKVKYRENESMFFCGSNEKLIKIIGPINYSLKENIKENFLFFKQQNK